jgi:chorismate dehydratase
MLRIGCVKYLNARPLIHGGEGDVDFDHPSALCNKLAAGRLDVALVSSFEFLRNPIYRIVDDVSISSDGPVYSVMVAHRGEIDQIEEIELDPASETSVNLLRCLLAELGLKPRLIGNIDLQSVRPAGLEPAALDTVQGPAFRAFDKHADIQQTRRNLLMFPAARRARLVIGDQAVRFRRQYANECSFWDLGEHWQKSVGLPFVYALWLIRPEVSDPKEIANRLRNLRDGNLANLDDLITELVAGVADPGARKELMREFLSRYYREHLRFSFGEREKEGLRIFANLCMKHSLLPNRDLALRVI